MLRVSLVVVNETLSNDVQRLPGGKEMGRLFAIVHRGLLLRYTQQGILHCNTCIHFIGTARCSGSLELGMFVRVGKVDSVSQNPASSVVVF